MAFACVVNTIEKGKMKPAGKVGLFRMKNGSQYCCFDLCQLLASFVYQELTYFVSAGFCNVFFASSSGRLSDNR